MPDGEACGDGARAPSSPGAQSRTSTADARRKSVSSKTGDRSAQTLGMDAAAIEVGGLAVYCQAKGILSVS
jgi:hypothetical protein